MSIGQILLHIFLSYTCDLVILCSSVFLTKKSTFTLSSFLYLLACQTLSIYFCTKLVWLLIFSFVELYIIMETTLICRVLYFYLRDNHGSSLSHCECFTDGQGFCSSSHVIVFRELQHSHLPMYATYKSSNKPSDIQNAPSKGSFRVSK